MLLQAPAAKKCPSPICAAWDVLCWIAIALCALALAKADAIGLKQQTEVSESD